MKALCIVLFLLFLISCFASETVSDASLLNTVEIASPSKPGFQLDGRKFKVLDVRNEKLEKRRKNSDREEDDGGEDELIYNVDYHGVSTHPSPSPKHPRPKHQICRP